MLDPSILSSAFPYGRILHYWVKASLFINPVATYILTSAGNIPVDRKSKDRNKLFKGTFKALSQNQAIALFPEGTSYTEPRIMQVKDGAAWAALEYTRWVTENGNKGDPVVIVPAAISYTNKSKYRSNVIMELVDLFCTPDLAPNVNNVKRNLLTYYSLLQSTQLTNSVLSSLPLPESLDPLRPIPLPSRLLTLSILVRDSLSSIVRLPLFILPLAIHAPAYVVGRLGAKLVEDEEETQAQNKAVFGIFVLAIAVYPMVFFFLWSCLRYTSTGALVAIGFLTLLAKYHNRLINDNYEHAKRVVATWRVLVGVWAPKQWDLSVNALSQYTVPKLPPANQWIDRSRSKSRTGSGTSSPVLPPLNPAISEPAAPARKTKKDRRPPSRRLIRHVLRARIEAAKSLASLLQQLDRTPDKRVSASAHLARAFGGQVDPVRAQGILTEDGVEVPDEPTGWRSAGEVLGFLRSRGAKIGGLKTRVQGEWAAVSSEGEGEDSTAGSGEDVVWVSPERS
ncbi:hypothetical protein EUX98_g7574 [Antrodiella citrinella]|uniref:Phospholipid/glycerol acyltransferase domain-containing protein n=1 Tax=Antrodiella citrinella TaxID=2447956 RepID=A0A4V3XHU1_9APHY|nr:hypothetical protein EUX98_g7574 [Antrodiella citrinella]